MANLQIKGIDNDLYAQIKALAASENRSVSQQILFLTREYLAKRGSIQHIKTPAQTLLNLAGSWADEQTAAEAIQDIRNSRKNSKKLQEGF
jgi:hypothetical protein